MTDSIMTSGSTYLYMTRRGWAIGSWGLERCREGVGLVSIWSSSTVTAASCCCWNTRTGNLAGKGTLETGWQPALLFQGRHWEGIKIKTSIIKIRFGYLQAGLTQLKRRWRVILEKGAFSFLSLLSSLYNIKKALQGSWRSPPQGDAVVDQSTRGRVSQSLTKVRARIDRFRQTNRWDRSPALSRKGS